MITSDGFVDAKKTEKDEAVRRAAATEPRAKPPPRPTMRTRAT
jgi:hypothetical protein